MGLLRLTGVVQHYAWGGATFLPDLLGVPNPDGRPFAEYWLGAHPSAPSLARVGDTDVPLDELLARNPSAMLGAVVAERFGGRLPYLLKVLDARQMLSLQAHPSLQQAREGFARENARGLAPDDPRRSYRDDNHKPEVHVALTDFWMLHGFREPADLARTLAGVPELAPLAAALPRPVDGDAVRALYNALMRMPQADVDVLLAPLVERLEATPPPNRDEPDFWALRAARTFPLPDGHIDRGVAAIYLLNLVCLRPGQGTYQPAGTLHAYLEGANVELMANSDNVLRGGLTPKHIDTDELLSAMSFRCGAPGILEGGAGGETIYRTPAEEFELAALRLGPGRRAERPAGRGPDTLIVLEGSVEVAAQTGAMKLGRGQSAFAPHDVDYSVTAGAAGALVYRASVPAMGA